MSQEQPNPRLAIQNPGQGFFVTGTDTGVGKTVVAAALLHAFAAKGLRAVGMKPVAAGLERIGGELRHADVEALVAAGNVAAPREVVNPYCFAEPIAPHIGAAQAGVAIDIERIAARFGQLAAMSDMVIVEGVGGFRVPLGPGVDAADLAARLALPVILVVGMRLGCLNHALLTQEAIAARGLALAGWVANHVDRAMQAADENVEALRERLRAPLLARIAFTHEIDPRALAPRFDLAPLR
jgi:dethiobiotin synthetase